MKHLSCEAQKKAIVKKMSSSLSLQDWKAHAEEIRQLYHGTFPSFWNTLLYKKSDDATQSVFEKAHTRWQIRAAGTSTRHQ